MYKLKDSELGFYHTGIEIFGREFTYCCDKGIVRHKPRRCEWGHFLGTICLGDVCLTLQQLEQLLEEMSREGFSSADYDVMENSCNVFSEVRYNSFYCDITSWRIRLLPLNLVSPTTSPPLFTIKPRWGQCLLRLSGQKLFDFVTYWKVVGNVYVRALEKCSFERKFLQPPMADTDSGMQTENYFMNLLMSVKVMFL